MQVVCGGHVVVVASIVLALVILLRVTLAHTLHPVCWLLEWEVAPVHVICSEPNHVLHPLSARGTLQCFRGKHRIILIAFSLQRHEQVVQILQILLQQLMSLIILYPVCKLVHEVINQHIKSDQTGLKSLEVIDVSLLDQLIVQVLNIDFVVQLEGQVVASVLKSYDSLKGITDHLL